MEIFPGPLPSALCAAYFVKLYCDTQHPHREHPPVAEQHRRPGKPLQADLQDPGRAAAGHLRQGPPGHPALHRPLHGEEGGADRAGVRHRGGGQPGCRCPGPADAESGCGQGTYILGKDLPLEQTIANMSGCWRAWASRSRSRRGAIWCPTSGRCISAMRIRRCVSPTARARPRSALASRRWANTSSASTAIISTTTSSGARTSPTPFVHYPDERWFKPGRKDALPAGHPRRLLPGHLQPDGELRASHLYDTNSGNVARHLRAALCAPVGRRGGVFPDQPDRQPVPQQRHERRQHAGRRRRCNACRKSSSGRSSANHRRRNRLPDVPPEVLAKISRHRRRHRGHWKTGLSGAGEGCVAGRRFR